MKMSTKLLKTRNSGFRPISLENSLTCGLGLWENGKYNNLADEFQNDNSVRVQTLDYHAHINGETGIYAEFTLYNPFNTARNIKMICIFNDLNRSETTAFYSPQEDSIIQLRDDNLAYMSGTIGGSGLGQYSIVESSRLKYEGCFKSLDRGELYFSPLAKGNLSIIYTLETTIEPRGYASGAAWTVVSPVREKAVKINNSLRKKRTSILF
ncbi:hypothetical protein JOC77_002743 [Peribacillus deserti]|uniref:Uncharacterized protein n=1 Tax=Peribacillus deserti TaxID=673318 RepID=A0ABS2QJG3_9BACI|nr:hypothetical protein [Peribacillus deserti]MBM7693303.1 hypothetical protein [Peribacillus deserti]